MSLLRTIMGQHFGSWNLDSLITLCIQKAQKRADSCKDRFILSFISAQELDCFDYRGLDVFTFWRIAGQMLRVLVTLFQYNLWCSTL